MRMVEQQRPRHGRERQRVDGGSGGGTAVGVGDEAAGSANASLSPQREPDLGRSCRNLARRNCHAASATHADPVAVSIAQVGSDLVSGRDPSQAFGEAFDSVRAPVAATSRLSGPSLITWSRCTVSVQI